MNGNLNKDRTAPQPAVGRQILVLNALPGQVGPAPAVITRVWSEAGAPMGMVNVTIFPDGGPVIMRTSVGVYASQAECEKYLATMPGHKPLVGYWPARDYSA